MSSTTLTYYPIYMHKAHPLNGAWVKLSAKLIEDLVVPSGWEASHPGSDIPGAAPPSALPKFVLFHYLNHPLPYVQLCGVVVEITYNNDLGFVTLKLDDSSGFLVTALVKQWTDTNVIKEKGTGNSLTKIIEIDATKTTKRVIRCCGWLSNSIIDILPIRIGTVLRIKGRLSLWRFGRQILVEKYDVFYSTAQEVDYWKGMTRDFKNVLKEPWYLTEQSMLELKTSFELEKRAREKHLLRIERRARKEREGKKSRVRDVARQGDKEAQHKAQSEEVQVQDPVPVRPLMALSTRGPLLHAGLVPPSYQVPRKDFISDTSSSLDDQARSGDKPVKSDHMEDTATTAEISKETASTSLNQSNLSSSKQESTFPPTDTEDSTKPAQQEFVDTGIPSRWEEIDISTEGDPISTFYGTDWTKLRDKLATQLAKSVEVPVHQPQEAKQYSSVMEEWDDLVV